MKPVVTIAAANVNTKVKHLAKEAPRGARGLRALTTSWLLEVEDVADAADGADDSLARRGAIKAGDFAQVNVDRAVDARVKSSTGSCNSRTFR